MSTTTIVWSPSGKFVSVACSGEGSVTEIAVREGKPLLLGSKQVIVGLTQVYLTVLPGGRCLLIGDTARGRIGSLPVMPNGYLVGNVKWRPCPYPFATTLSRDGRFAYTLDPKDNLIAQFSVENGNSLSPLKPAFVQTPNDPTSFAVAGLERLR